MSLESEAAGVLASAAIGRINFHIEGFHVSPLRLQAVGKAIGKSVKVVFGQTGKKLGAGYSPITNTIKVPFNSVAGNKIREGAIVHEAVHAVIDINKGKHLTGLSDECAAYLGEVLYLTAQHTVPTSDDKKVQAIYDAASGIVRSEALLRGGIQLSRKQIAPLRTAVHNHPAYSGYGDKELTTANG